MIISIIAGFDLSFWSAVVKIYPFANLCWVNKDENIQSNKLSWPIGQYIPHIYWKLFFCLKLLFLRPNQHFLLGFSNINNRIQWKENFLKVNYRSTRCWSGAFIVKLDNTWHVVLVLFFADFEHVNSGWNALLH